MRLVTSLLWMFGISINICSSGSTNSTTTIQSFEKVLQEKILSLVQEIDLGFQVIVDSIIKDELVLETSLFENLHSISKSTHLRLNATVGLIFNERKKSTTASYPGVNRSLIGALQKPDLDLIAYEENVIELLATFNRDILQNLTENSKTTDFQGNESFHELFEQIKKIQRSSLLLKEETQKVAIREHVKESSQSSVIKLAHDKDIWNKTYNWDAKPVSELTALNLIDAVQLNMVRNHFSPHHHVEASLSRRYHSRIVPEYNADLDLRTSARMFPLNIAQDTSISESSMLFQHNLKALSALVSMVDDAAAELQVVDSIMARYMHIDIISSAVDENHELSFASVPAIEASLISLEQSFKEKQVRFFVDRIIHIASLRILDKEVLHKLHIMNVSVSSTSRCDHLKTLQNHQDSLTISHTELTLDLTIVYMQHAINLYLLAHDLWRSLTEISSEGNAAVSYHRATIATEAAIERKNEIISLDRIKVIGEEGRRTLLHTIDLCFEYICKSLLYSMSTTEGIRSFSTLLTLLLVLIFSLTMIRYFVMISVSIVRKACLMPTIIRESSRSSFFRTIIGRNEHVSPKVILPEDQDRQLSDLISYTLHARHTGLALRNIIIHGPPGTGKTLLARQLLRSIPNVPYVIMSGSDLVPLGRSAPLELKRILLWAIRHKGIVVIDEAECALAQRLSNVEENNLDNEVARDIINVFLSLTGEASSNLMLLIMTCHPDKLDDAVLDRCDDIFHLHRPSQRERLLILKQCFFENFNKEIVPMGRRYQCRCTPDFDTNLLVNLSLKSTEGFSGRELHQIIKAITLETHLTEDRVMTISIWEEVTKRMCYSIKMKKGSYE